MASETIRKEATADANLVDYQAACRGFSWATAAAALDGLPTGGLNLGYEAVDRHARGPRAQLCALRWLGKDGSRRDLSYAELSALSDRFARVLHGLGVGPGDRVFALAGRVPELYVAALGTVKNRSVFCPLFSAFGPEPVRQRLSLGSGRVLVTTRALYRRKVIEIRSDLSNLEHVILLDGPSDEAGLLDGPALLEAAGDAPFTVEYTAPDEPALLHFTSGTTGLPKGAIHVHEAAVAHLHTARVALDLRDGDRFWCTADPGWVTGTSYGIFAPLLAGVTSVVDEAEFDARRWYDILERERVTVWYTAPTALRMLVRSGGELAAGRDLSALRHIASVGEPLEPETVTWGRRHLGHAIHDTWWQTETGAIMIANYRAVDVRPGSMGRPVPGIEAGVVRRTPDGAVKQVPDGEEGELALRMGWPSMFRGYLGDPARYARCFADGWYLTGDLARRDAEGYFWFVGRADDVIKTAGHLIGPFEVERVLVEHPSVAEAAVIGKPHPVAGEIIKAFVVLHVGHADSPALQADIVAFARRRLGAAVAPRELAVVNALPHTRSGKTMRRLLKARELGLPEGDLSTLENP